MEQASHMQVVDIALSAFYCSENLTTWPQITAREKSFSYVPRKKRTLVQVNIVCVCVCTHTHMCMLHHVQLFANSWTNIIPFIWGCGHSESMFCVLSCSVMSDSLRSHGLQPPGSSVHGIFQVRILEWVTTSYSRGSFLNRVQIHISCIGKWILYHPRHLGRPNETEIKLSATPPPFLGLPRWCQC